MNALSESGKWNVRRHNLQGDNPTNFARIFGSASPKDRELNPDPDEGVGQAQLRKIRLQKCIFKVQVQLLDVSLCQDGKGALLEAFSTYLLWYTQVQQNSQMA